MRRRWRPPALALGGHQSGDEVKYEDDRAGQKQGSDQGNADDRRVDPGVVRDPGGDAHDLGIAPVDQEFVGHSFLHVQAMSEVALLTNSMAVMKAAARAVAVSRLAEKVANICLVPFCLTGPPLGHGLNYAGTVPI